MNKILQSVISSQYSFPPQLSQTTKVSTWKDYILQNKINPPRDFDPFFLVDLPGNEKQTTYLAWARMNAVVEESHDDEDEYLFMLKGTCLVTINGKTTAHKEGDLIFIPAKAFHRAEATSDEMILVGQRMAA